jgi:hypothetical protein
MASVVISSPAIDAAFCRGRPNNLGRVNDALGNEVYILGTGLSVEYPVQNAKLASASAVPAQYAHDVENNGTESGPVWC